MSELQLSKDLNVITAEINSYKQVAGQAIFEIGRRLKVVRDNPSVYGLNGYRDWEKWCENNMDLSRTHANRFIKIAEELEPSGIQDLGIKALYEIATLPQEEREKEHVTSKGETKTVDEMTVRELQEVKRKLKNTEQAKQQAESQAEIERKERERLENELENQEPERVEVPPNDYDQLKGGYKELEKSVYFYKEQYEEMKEELKDLEDQLNNREEYSTEAIRVLEEKKELLFRSLNQVNKLFQLMEVLDEFMPEVISKTKTINFNEVRNETEILNEIEMTVDSVMDWCKEIKGKLPDKNIIEGEIVND